MITSSKNGARGHRDMFEAVDQIVPQKIEHNIISILFSLDNFKRVLVISSATLRSVHMNAKHINLIETGVPEHMNTVSEYFSFSMCP